MPKPTTKPANPRFSSGPCAKRPGWTVAALQDALVGRSHRSQPGKARIQDVLDRSRAILGLPDDYRIAIVPASDTGAVEMALWSLLGARGVDVLAWESFGEGWITDIVKQLKLPDVRALRAGYGQLPDLQQVSWDRDVVFTWNGTTAGVKLPDGDWIAEDRQGLAIADATSAVFAMDLPWRKLDGAPGATTNCCTHPAVVPTQTDPSVAVVKTSGCPLKPPIGVWGTHAPLTLRICCTWGV